jgi:hypothetical protein
MDRLKQQIADSIKMPYELYNLTSEFKDEIIATTYKILDLHFKGVIEQFLSDSQVNRVLSRIEFYSRRLRSLTDSQLFLQLWLWIGQTTEEWLKWSLEEEHYECATNLRKIINFEYVAKMD